MDRPAGGRAYALILAGGASSRMGADKPLLRLGGGTLLERAAAFWRGSGRVEGVLIAVGAEGRLADALPPDTAAVPDLYPGCGPMAGLHAAFTRTDAELLYVSAADMPFLTAEAIPPAPSGDAVVYVRKGRPEPLFGVYRRSALAKIHAALLSGRRKMIELLSALDTEYLPLPEAYAPALQNLNTRADYFRACAGHPPTVAFVGWSGAGKTTFLEKLLPALTARGLRVAAVKSDSHGFQIDRPGKDTYRLAAAGAVCTGITGPNGWALLGKDEMDFEALRGRLPPVDLVLAEGHKASPLPKIEVHRRATGKPLAAGGELLMAVVTDEPLDVDAPQLGPDDVGACADLLCGTLFPGNNLSAPVTRYV